MSDLREKLVQIDDAHSGGSFTLESDDDYDWDLDTDDASDHVDAWYCRCGATGKFDPPVTWSEARAAMSNHKADAALVVIEGWLRDRANWIIKNWPDDVGVNFAAALDSLADSITPPKGDET